MEGKIKNQLFSCCKKKIRKTNDLVIQYEWTAVGYFLCIKIDSVKK